MGRIGCSLLRLLVALFPGAGVECPFLSSRVLWRRLRALPCSSVCGLHCTGPTNARQSQWETVISCAGGQVLPGPLGLRIVSDASGSFLPQGCSMELSKTTVSFWLRMPLSWVCRLLVTERSVLCPLSSALILARQLRGRCPSVPRNLPLVLCGGGAGPGFARACSPRRITAYDLETGPWAMFPRSFSYHPPTSHGMSRLVVRVCLHILKCCLYSGKYWITFLLNLSFLLK